MKHTTTTLNFKEGNKVIPTGYTRWHLCSIKHDSWQKHVRTSMCKMEFRGSELHLLANHKNHNTVVIAKQHENISDHTPLADSLGLARL